MGLSPFLYQETRGNMFFVKLPEQSITSTTEHAQEAMQVLFDNANSVYSQKQRWNKKTKTKKNTEHARKSQLTDVMSLDNVKHQKGSKKKKRATMEHKT